MNNDPKSLWEVYREKIAKAKSAQDKIKGESWLGTKYEILGVALSPLSLRKLLYLEAINSPLLDGSKATREDLISFLWICSEKFTENPNQAKEFRARFKFPKKKQSLGDEVTEYLNDAFSFAQKGEASSNDTEHFVSNVVDTMAHQYGWDCNTILDMPMSRLFQLLQSITKRMTIQSGSKYIQFDPITDALKAEYLQKLKENN